MNVSFPAYTYDASGEQYYPVHFPTTPAYYYPNPPDPIRHEYSGSRAQWHHDNSTMSRTLHSNLPADTVPLPLYADDRQSSFNYTTLYERSECVEPPPSPASHYTYHDPSAHAEVFTTFPTPSELLSNLGVAMDCINPSTPRSEASSSSSSSSDGTGTTQLGSPQLDLSLNASSAQPVQDAISSHEKKRQLMECLEQYVIYLHDLLAQTGVQPVPLERVSTYRGLSSRSIRTLLVHMENENKKLGLKIMAEEQRFLELREAWMKRDMGPTAHEM